MGNASTARKATTLAVIFSFITAPLTAGAQETEPVRVLVRDFEGLGAGDALVKSLHERVVGALGSRQGYRVSTDDDIRKLIAAQAKEDPKCVSDACLSSAVEATLAQYLITGSVGVVGGDRVASLTLIDAERFRPVGGASATFGSDEELLAAAGALIGHTFDWEDAPTLDTASFSLPEDGTLKIALMDLQGLGLTPESAKSLTQVLGGSLKQVKGADVITQEDIKSMLQLEAQKQVLGCDDMSCMAEIGGALGVDRMITGSVGLMENRYVVSLRLIDPRAGKVEARVTESFVGVEEQLLPAVRYGGKRLLGALGDTGGSLAVSSNETSAALYLNDQEAGELPMQALDGLTPGRYSLRVAKGGYYDWRSDVFVEPGAATPVWAELSEKPPKWYETWWFWTAVGVVAVGAGTFYVVNATSLPDTDLGNVSFR